MGLSNDAIKVDSWDFKKSKGRKNKVVDDDDAVEETGCCISLRFISCSFTSRSKVDSSVSSTITHEIKSTNDRSRDEQVATIISSTTTSNTESNSSSSKLEEELKVSSRLRKFSFNDLKLATRNFRPESLLGEGGFGCVFKGWIEENGTAPAKPGTGLTVAVKTLNHDGLQGHKEWMAEVNYLGDLIHPNLVKLIGYCIEDDQRLLAYEFMPRGSLENHLFRRSLPLPWPIRMKIALGAAKGLAFLHEEAERPVIYRDFKTSNILLDAEYNAKLSDFGLAKDAPDEGKTHVSTRVMGTYGYAAPEYVMTGHLTSKNDVYSFGVVLLEMLTGRRSMDKNRPNGEHNLVQWARPHLLERRRFYRLIDPRLEGHFSIKGAEKAAWLAAHCVSRDPKARPRMSEVVEALKPLPNLKDMATTSYFQTVQDDRNSSGPDRKNGFVNQGSFSRNPHMTVTPLDLVKCNMQIDPAKYKSISSGFGVLLKEQGVRGFFRGWVPTLLGYSAQGACKFGFYEYFKKYYSDLAGPENAAKYKTFIYLAGSASAEVIADIALCPFEAVKVRVQTQPGFARGLGDGLPKFVKSEGALGLYKGLVPLWGRQIPYTMMKFASFETIVEQIYKNAIPTPKNECSKTLQLGVSFAGGYIAGVLCAIVSHPADNLVSFLNNAKGATVGDAVKKLGLWGLFTRGLPLRIVMIGTLTGAQWGIYDAFKVSVGLPTTGGVTPAPATAKA